MTSVVVIGAGQAGLAVSHELSEHGVDHVVLERRQVGQSWRDRWDSFRRKRSRGWLDDTLVGRTAADRGRGCRWSIGVSPLIHVDLR